MDPDARQLSAGSLAMFDDLTPASSTSAGGEPTSASGGGFDDLLLSPSSAPAPPAAGPALADAFDGLESLAAPPLSPSTGPHQASPDPSPGTGGLLDLLDDDGFGGGPAPPSPGAAAFAAPEVPSFFADDTFGAAPPSAPGA
eukprot:1196556-Prymnesium_polylepis.1